MQLWSFFSQELVAKKPLNQRFVVICASELYRNLGIIFREDRIIIKLCNHLTSSSGTFGWPMNIRHVVTIGINVNTPTNETIADACFATHLRIFSPPLFLWKHCSTKCIKQTKKLPKREKQRLKFIFSFQTLFFVFQLLFYCCYRIYDMLFITNPSGAWKWV